MLLGNEFYTKNEVPLDFNEIITAKEFIVLYFGALYNPGSAKFTDYLSMFYQEVNANEKMIEVIYVSYDRNYKEFRKHMDSMPWVTLPY